MEKYPLNNKVSESQERREIQNKVSLSEQDVYKIKQITSGIDVIPNEVKEHASADILKTLENNHPLNSVWRNENGEIVGYLAFEDFAQDEAYAKYFATDGTLKDNAFSFIPELVQHAKSLGYTKIHFHGWNPRLNKVLEHFGFVKTHTDKQGSLSADHFEIKLDKVKDETSEQKIKEVFENKYLNHIIKEVEKTIETLDEEQNKIVDKSYSELTERLNKQEGFELNDVSKTILKLKLARYIQRHDSIDSNTLFDAIVETPKFLDKDKGGFDRLLELHEQKTLTKIAEMRKIKAEQKGDESFNPYEALFQTNSGEYYMARLLNMPHLEEESLYMNHCVGTSDSYINKLKKGDIEILSFRKTPKINPQTQKLEGDQPIITMEYNIRTKIIQQVKIYSDGYIMESGRYFGDFMEALKKLKETKCDTGEKRDFKEISESELGMIKVKNYHLFTEKGEISLKDYDTESNLFVLKMGRMDVTKDIAKEDASKIFRIVEGVELKPKEFTYDISEVDENTKAYIGEWNPTIYQKIKNFTNITHFYESFPDKKIFTYELTTDTSIQSSEQAKAKLESKGIWKNEYTEDLLDKTEYSKESKTYKLVQFTVGQLGFPQGATTDQIYAKAEELGLKLCPAEVGPQLRLSYPGKDWKLIAMKQISDRNGGPFVFFLNSGDSELRLYASYARPSDKWDSDNQFVFLAS